MGNVAERGPLATGHRMGPSPIFWRKRRNESVSGCGFLSTKT